MSDLRLQGFPLRAARVLAESALARKVLWPIVSADFHIDTLHNLPTSALGKVEEVPVPITGAPPRSWGDGTDLGTPASPRCTGAKLRAAYADGSSTPTAVLERLFHLIDTGAFGECTHSPFVTLDRDVATKAAAASSERWSKGEARSSIDGIPVPIKDEFYIRGLPTMGGTQWRTEPATEDAVLVQRLREEGAILPGSAHATENGMNALGFNPNHDMPRSVYSADHGAGGSSTGSAAVVGLGLATVALGTDGGGSIRVPAAMNGVFGLKPSFNRFSGTGDTWKGSVGHPGPIGQSISDLVDLMETGTGFDPQDPYTHFPTDWDHVRATWRPAIGRGIRGCRIGVLHKEFEDADPRIAAKVMEALSALEAEGAILTDVSIDHLAVVNAIGPIIIASESAANAASDQELHRHETSEELRLVYGLMRAVDAPLYLACKRARTGIRLRTAALLSGVDLLALPTHARQNAPYPRQSGLQIADTSWIAAMTRFSFLANLTGLPALSAPIGMVDGLPVSMQFVGDAWDEASPLAAGAHLERMGVTHLPLPPGYVDLSA